MNMMKPKQAAMKVPEPQKPAPVPTIDEGRIAAQDAEAALKRRGRASNILTSYAGDTTKPALGAAALLG